MIVPIRMLPAHEREQTRSGIEHEKQNAPPLILAYVNVLVRSQASEHVVIDADDHMAEGDGGELHRARQSGHQAVEMAAADFQYTIDNPTACAERPRGNTQQ